MIHRTLLPTFFVGVLLLGCAEKKSTVTTTPAPEQKRATSDTRTATTPVKPEPIGEKNGGVKSKGDTLFFYLERTPCFGSCKSYRINVYRSGYATFEGRANVEKIGMHKGFVGKDSLDKLLKAAERYKFLEMKDRYDNPNVTDLPSTIIRMVAQGKDKQVVGRHGTPEAFTQFANEVETLLYPIAWRPVPAEE